MISIITPVFNQSVLTHKFLYNNWLLYNTRPDVDWIIVNNGSVDNTAGILATWKDKLGYRLTVITNEQNKGFGPANNQAAAQAKGDVLIFVNNDVLIYGDYVTPIAKMLDDVPRAIVGAELIAFDTGWNVFGDELIQYITGWCFGVTRETWRDLGGFDERFVPCDYEDMDLSVTATKQGRNLIRVDVPLKHIFGQTADKMDGGRQAITNKNRRLFTQKWSFEDGKS